jgi:hypothetical protein
MTSTLRFPFRAWERIWTGGCPFVSTLGALCLSPRIVDMIWSRRPCTTSRRKFALFSCIFLAKLRQRVLGRYLPWSRRMTAENESLLRTLCSPYFTDEHSVLLCAFLTRHFLAESHAYRLSSFFVLFSVGDDPRRLRLLMLRLSVSLRPSFLVSSQ